MACARSGIVQRVGLDAVAHWLQFAAAAGAALDDIESLVPAVSAGLAKAGVRLLAIYSRAVFPEQFNHLSETHGNKAEVLSRLTLELIAAAMARLPNDAGPQPVRIICDRHGGRCFYRPLVQQQFADDLVQVCAESPTESIYAWTNSTVALPRRWRFAFAFQARNICRSRWLRWLRSIYAKRQCWRSIASGGAQCPNFVRRPDIRSTPGDSKRKSSRPKERNGPRRSHGVAKLLDRVALASAVGQWWEQVDVDLSDWCGQH